MLDCERNEVFLEGIGVVVEDCEDAGDAVDEVVEEEAVVGCFYAVDDVGEFYDAGDGARGDEAGGVCLGGLALWCGWEGGDKLFFCFPDCQISLRGYPSQTTEFLTQLLPTSISISPTLRDNARAI